MESSKFDAVYAAGSREQCTAMARVASKAHRHEDTLNFMKTVVTIADAEGDDPTEEERTLLWEAYKTVVNARREARKVLLAEEELKRESEKEGGLVKGDTLTQDLGAQTVIVDELYPIASTTKDDGNIASTQMILPKEVDDGLHNEDDDAASAQREVSMLGLLKLYRELIEDEICRYCRDFVKLLDDQVHAQDEEGKAYFLQLKADHLRYICEVQTGEVRKNTAKKVLNIYLEAQAIAKKVLAARHPTRLGLALNFAVFHCDILGSKEAALALSKEAIQEVEEEANAKNNVRVLGLFDDSKGIEGQQMLDMLKGNINLWSLNEDNEKSTGDASKT